MLDTPSSYPGALTRPQDLLRLAAEYQDAACVLAGRVRKGDPVSRAPYRLTAIHAVELYLNALLVHAGHEPARVRALQHDLAKRTDLSIESGLALRHRTAEHLRTMTTSREYLVTRYEPELASTLSQLNRLAATLDEVATKVRVMVAGERSLATTRTAARHHRAATNPPCTSPGA